MAYIERNPVRAGICARARDYEWSSARAHVDETSSAGFLDLRAWRDEYDGQSWERILEDTSNEDDFGQQLQGATLRGRPCCEPGTLEEFERELGRLLRARPPGRPRKPPKEEGTQIDLEFASK